LGVWVWVWVVSLAIWCEFPCELGIGCKLGLCLGRMEVKLAVVGMMGVSMVVVVAAAAVVSPTVFLRRTQRRSRWWRWGTAYGGEYVVELPGFAADLLRRRRRRRLGIDAAAVGVVVGVQVERRRVARLTGSDTICHGPG
jgi:hypothetical protein